MSALDEWKATLRRWLTENTADTRTHGVPPGRLYAAPFARVWDALLSQIRSRPRWELAHEDEERGQITVRCRSLVLRFVDDLIIWVELDENGQTRVDARSASRVGRGDFGVNRRRLVRLFEELDRQVGPETRLRRDPPSAEGDVRPPREPPGAGGRAPRPPSGRPPPPP